MGELVDATHWVELEGKALARAAERVVQFGVLTSAHERVEVRSDKSVQCATRYTFERRNGADLEIRGETGERGSDAA